MLSRRVFLLSAFLAPGISLLQRPVFAAGLNSSKVLVLTENNCVDTAAFSSCLPAMHIQNDPSAVLLELANSFTEGEYDLVLGLSRDSNYVLIEQYAQAARYHLTYHGTHTYEANSLRHSLQGGRETINSISRQLSRNNKHWTDALIQLPAMATCQETQRVSEVINTKHMCPSGSPGQLVSWLFERNPS